MYSGIDDLYKCQMAYCKFRILYEECHWWEFTRKKVIKEQLDWFYPLMKGEVKFLTLNKNKWR